VVDQVLGQLTLRSLLGSEREVATLAVIPRAVPLPVARTR
jgi:hypothetical protein